MKPKITENTDVWVDYDGLWVCMCFNLTCPTDLQARGLLAVHTQHRRYLSWWFGHCSFCQICCGRCVPRCWYCSGIPLFMLRNMFFDLFSWKSWWISMPKNLSILLAMLCSFCVMYKHSVNKKIQSDPTIFFKFVQILESRLNLFLWLWMRPNVCNCSFIWQDTRVTKRTSGGFTG